MSCTTSIGKVEFDENGEATIPDDKFDELKSVMADIEIVGKVSNKKSEKVPDPVDPEEAIDPVKTGTTEDDLRELSLIDLKEMASQIPDADIVIIGKMKKKDDLIKIILAEMNK